jgi:hypothetical protein
MWAYFVSTVLDWGIIRRGDGLERDWAKYRPANLRVAEIVSCILQSREIL